MLSNLRLGLGLSYDSGGITLPYTFFTGGEDGAWFPTNDLTSMWTTSVGETQVAASLDNLGLILDKAQMGGKTAAVFIANQPELITNGDFPTDDTGWTSSESVPTDQTNIVNINGLRITNVTAVYGLIYQTFTTVVGERYRVQLELTETSGSNFLMRIGTAGGLGDIASYSIAPSLGVKHGIFTAIGTTTYFSIGNSTNNMAAYQTIDDASVKAIPGNHALNATAAQLPVYTIDENGDFLIDHDEVDDVLAATVPDLGADATLMYLLPGELRIEEDLTIGAGAYSLPATQWRDVVLIDRELTAGEISAYANYANSLGSAHFPVVRNRMQTIMASAVDAFVYDTSKDSDGGAWRTGAIALATSWYSETLNTATRGARAEFPEVAVIVAEATKVTIYDGDDPDLPMWMVFNGASYRFAYTSAMSSIIALNGIICSGNNGAGFLGTAEFLADKWTINNGGGGNTVGTILSLSRRNDTFGAYDSVGSSGVGVIVNHLVNDVAMTVLSGAPVDVATGIETPTIAVATDGGVSVITDGGDVWDITNSNGTYTFSNNVRFNTLGGINISLGTSSTWNHWVYIFDELPTADTAITYNSKGASGLAPVAYTINTTNFNSDFQSISNSAGSLANVFDLVDNAHASGLGLTLWGIDVSDGAKSLHAHITTSYNTGYMVGAIKGAWLSSVDATDLVGGDLVTNGAFAADTDWTKGTGWTIGSGIATHATGTSSAITQDIGVTAGNVHQCVVTISGRTAGSLYWRIGGQTNDVAMSANGTITKELVSEAADTEIELFADSIFDGSIDDVSVILMDDDRSVNANGLAAYGTITKTAVATDAELMAYSGFSASNYLEQPYNSDLDFGTGDFCVMGWAKLNGTTGHRYLFERRTDGGTGNYIRIFSPSAASTIQFSINGRDLAGSVSLGTSDWAFVVAVRDGGTMSLYVDGVLDDSVSGVFDISNVTAISRIGLSSTAATPFDGSLALWRIGATAPTAAQILEIYNAELPLFQDRGAATLIGSSDVVTALAHDDGLSANNDLVDNNVASAWTVYGTNTVVDDGGAVKVTYVDNKSGAYLDLTDAKGLSEDLVKGEEYLITANVKVSAGASLDIDFWNGLLQLPQQTITNTGYAAISLTLRIANASTCSMLFDDMSAGESVWVKDLEVRKVQNGLLHVGTSGGRSVFDGLERKYSSADAVATVIDVSGGLVLEK